MELHFNFLLFRFGENRRSGDIIKDQYKQFNEFQDIVASHYEKLSEITLAMKDTLLKGQLNIFANLLDDAWKIKKNFSPKISNNLVDDLYDSSKKSGAIGGKVLGAGFSGYLLLYVNPTNQASVIDTMQAKGARLEKFDFVETGLESWRA